MNRFRQFVLLMPVFASFLFLALFLASMGGADALVFTGGIGEHSAQIRARICEGLEWAGLTIDASQNEETVGREGRISTVTVDVPAGGWP